MQSDERTRDLRVCDESLHTYLLKDTATIERSDESQDINYKGAAPLGGTPCVTARVVGSRLPTCRSFSLIVKRLASFTIPYRPRLLSSVIREVYPLGTMCVAEGCGYSEAFRHVHRQMAEREGEVGGAKPPPLSLKNFLKLSICISITYNGQRPAGAKKVTDAYCKYGKDFTSLYVRRAYVSCLTCRDTQAHNINCVKSRYV